MMASERKDTGNVLLFRPGPTATAKERAEAEQIIREICAETYAARQNWRLNLSGSARWRALKTEPQTTQITIALAAAHMKMPAPDARTDVIAAAAAENIRRDLLTQLLRRKLPFTPEQLRPILLAWLDQPHSLEYGLPGRAILDAVKRTTADAALSPELAAVLRRIRDRALTSQYQGQLPPRFAAQVIDSIDTLLGPAADRRQALPSGPFAQAFTRWIATLPETEAATWLDLALLCAETREKSAPSGKWLDATGVLVARLGSGRLGERLCRWMEETTPDPERRDFSLDIMKGLLWVSTHLDHGALAGEIGRFAEKCFQKVPYLGARSIMLGNAALWVLSRMVEEPRAAAELFRLRGRAKLPSTRAVADKRLTELAEQIGSPIDEMEDAALPSFWLDEASCLVTMFGDARATVCVEATGTVLQWTNAAGVSVKAPPAEVRRDFAAALASHRRRLKDIEEARRTQVRRLEQVWIEARSWTFGNWERHLLKHPLRRPIVASLIWCIGDAVVMPGGDGLTDIEGRPRRFDPDARVTLWHPLGADPATVLAWRARIIARGLTQAIKQAHREVYVLTDAERITGTYSNRFAAHILRQHVLKALCQERGWRYDLMAMAWDRPNVPTVSLPKRAMTAEYHVAVVDDDRESPAAVALHVTSDRVRFTDADDRPIELERIDPIVFSEVMRDVDLFVAVASVANDPHWTDGGPQERFRLYWEGHGFGDLGQSATTRRDVVKWLVPKLSIADRLEVTDRFLIVEGKRHKYAIHFGSGNIHILPDNRYLCIVGGREPKETANIKLPFTGDGMISIILAKAFLLVDESKIKDETILRQL